MVLWVILGVSLALLGAIVVVLLQVPESSEKRGRRKNVPAPDPPKDWKAVAERLEKRLKATEASFQSSQDEIKLRDRRIGDLAAEAEAIRKQFEQEKVWRQKEEAAVEKEKRQERLIEGELHKAREEVAVEATTRIKLEAELKEHRQVREDQGAQVRRLSSLNTDLDRRLNEAIRELRGLRDENAELRRKKEGEEWVAKTDYKRVEGLLKRARWEVEQFKRKIPSADWPRALQPKTADPSGGAAPSSVSAGVLPPAAGVPGPQEGLASPEARAAEMPPPSVPVVPDPAESPAPSSGTSS